MNDFPACFPDRESYLLWLKAATRVRESASPCDDCTPEYEAKMLDAGRCFRGDVDVRFRYHPQIQEGAI